MYQWLCDSPDETIAFGEALAGYLKPGDVLTLSGDLGAGKTTFTKGIAKGLGIQQLVNSPTFTIIKEYEGVMPLYHMDAYRIGGMEDLGFEEYFNGEGIAVVEWADNIREWLPEEYLNIKIHHLDATRRKIDLLPHGKGPELLCKELNKYERSSD